MMKIVCFLLISVCSFGQVLKEPDGQMWYWEYKDPACVSCPILIFLHGSGEVSGSPDLTKVQKAGLPKLLKSQGKTFVPGFTLLVPQRSSGNWGWIANPDDPMILKFIEYVKSAYAYDGRLFVTGLSMGGKGTWETTYNIHSYAGQVTAVVPVSTDGSFPGGKDVTAPRKIPVWMIYGDHDTTFSINSILNPVNGMAGGGFPAKVTAIVGGTHSGSTWDVAYSLTDRAELGNTTIYKWFLEQGVSIPPVPKIKDLIDSIYSYNGFDTVYFKFKSGRLIKK